MTSDLKSPHASRGLIPAAVVLTRIISRPLGSGDGSEGSDEKTHIITTDCGSKSIAAEAGSPVASVLGHPHLTPLKPSEEHLPIEVPPIYADRNHSHNLYRGKVMYLVPRHICPTVNLAEQALLAIANKSNDKKSEGPELEVIEIEARSHELVLPSEL